MSPIEGLAALCERQGLPWHDGWLPRLQQLAVCVAQGQQQTNLVGDASEAGVVEHVVEALTVAAAFASVAQAPPRRLADIGAGAGLEALTLALVWPDAEVVAVEPRIRRATFIHATAATLGLERLQVIQKTLHSAHLPPQFDLVTARAVWPAAEWLPRGLQLVQPRGLVTVHGKGPEALLSQQLQAWAAVRTCRAVPGPRGNAVALLSARR